MASGVLLGLGCFWRVGGSFVAERGEGGEEEEGCFVWTFMLEFEMWSFVIRLG